MRSIGLFFVLFSCSFCCFDFFFLEFFSLLVFWFAFFVCFCFAFFQRVSQSM